MKELDSYILSELAKIHQTKKEYIEECKQSFLKLDERTKEEIEELDTEDLEYELRITFDDGFKKALKYELMLRTDFEIRI